MPKTTSIYTRVEPEIKEQAEQILSKLGMPVSNAVNLFLHQVVLHNGIPFDLAIPQRTPLGFFPLSKEQLDAEIQKGLDDVQAGRTIPAEQVWAEMERIIADDLES